MNKGQGQFNPPKVQLKSIAPGILPGIGLGQMTELSCKCGGKVFYGIMACHHASPLQSVTGRPMLVKSDLGLACTLCHKVNDFDSKDISPISQNVDN